MPSSRPLVPCHTLSARVTLFVTAMSATTGRSFEMWTTDESRASVSEFGPREVERGRSLHFAPERARQAPPDRSQARRVRLHDDAHAIGPEIVKIRRPGRQALTVHGRGPRQKGSGESDE